MMQAMVAKSMLQEMGFDVDHVTIGEQAVSYFEANHCDIALMDIGLAGPLRGD